jgi:hypothetical protein
MVVESFGMRSETAKHSLSESKLPRGSCFTMCVPWCVQARDHCACETRSSHHFHEKEQSHRIASKTTQPAFFISMTSTIHNRCNIVTCTMPCTCRELRRPSLRYEAHPNSRVEAAAKSRGACQRPTFSGRGSGYDSYHCVRYLSRSLKRRGYA